MRFGQILWSSVDDGRFKLYLTIVEQNYDEQKRNPGFLEPQFGTVMTSLAATSGQVAKLLEVLQTKGLLTEEERLGITEISDLEREKRTRQFDRVSDLDRWLDAEEEED